jgi:NCS1 family nucleobase:cation symporter-1
MAQTEAADGIFQRLDRLNEFERQPVGKDKLHGGMYFAGNFAGEHVAATEFVIGALFVQQGIGAFDIVVGLLVGNLLAVLSWALVCAPIAVQTRLTLYWYLRKIAGPGVTVVYNVLNAVLYCILAGCMITVSASAVRIAFGVAPQTGWLPTDPYFVLVVLGVGAVVVALAILGFKRLAQFATICSPWMFLIFIAGALVMLPQLAKTAGIDRIGSFADFWKVANDQIWTGRPAEGFEKWGFWHVAAFAWICNLAMHLGLSDMALLRYARRASYGFYSALGMYLGHFLAWICAGIMGAAVASIMQMPLGKLDAGAVAFEALGVIGAVAVVIAGWTTSNPTLYRAGLALQVVTPGWPRWLVTLLAGTATTLIACSPFVFRELLGFVAIYGILLLPIGAIVVTEHWLFPRIGLTRYWNTRKGLVWNWPAVVSWGIPLVLAASCWYFEIIHQNFLLIPVWLLTAVLYIALSAMAGSRQSLPELPEETSQTAAAPSRNDSPSPPAPSVLYYGSGGLALVCLALCALIPLWIFVSGPDGYEWRKAMFENALVWITLVYFASGAVWMNQRERR